MSSFLSNKHIINRIRFILNDNNDTNSSFNAKVSIVNSWIAEYSANVYNYKRTKITCESDWKTFLLPNDFENIWFVRYESSYNTLIEWTDFFIYDNKIVLNTVNDTLYSNSVKIDLLYDAYLKDLVQESISAYTQWNNVSISVKNGLLYEIWEYILIKDWTVEQVLEIKDIILNTIVVDLLSTVTSSAFITWNIKIADADLWLIDDFARYKNLNILTSDWKTSESWTQWSTQQSVNYNSWKTSDTILENFYKRLSMHKNSKTQKTGSFTTLSIIKT